MGFWGKLTGLDIAKVVDEFEKIYGETLLGMHRDIESQKRLVQDYKEEMSSMLTDVKATQREAQNYKEEMSATISNIKEIQTEEQKFFADLQKHILKLKIALWISGSALLLSLFAIGGLIWMMKG